MSGPGALLASSRFEYGTRPPPVRRASLEPCVGVEPRAGIEAHANVQPRIDVQPRVGVEPRTNPEPRVEPRADPEPRADVEPQQQPGAGTPTRLPRGIRRLADWAMAAPVSGRILNNLVIVSFVLAALAWFSAPHICPTSDLYMPSFQSRGDAHGVQHEKATNMYFDAVKWMRHFQGQARRNSQANNALVTRAAELAERTRRLSASTSALKNKFEESEMDEASGLAYLEARLLRARDEAQFYQGDGWLWLVRIGCTSCGRVTHTTPCPEHPAAVALREVDAVRDVLSRISEAHRDLMKEHRAIQNSTLKPAHDEICVSGAHVQSQPKDFKATAFGMCRLTGRELQRGTEFRDEFASRVGERVSAALNSVHNISKELGDIRTGFSWSTEHVSLGVALLDGLLDVVTAQIAGGEEATDESSW